MSNSGQTGAIGPPVSEQPASPRPPGRLRVPEGEQPRGQQVVGAPSSAAPPKVVVPAELGPSARRRLTDGPFRFTAAVALDYGSPEPRGTGEPEGVEMARK